MYIRIHFLPLDKIHSTNKQKICDVTDGSRISSEESVSIETCRRTTVEKNEEMIDLQKKDCLTINAA